MPVDFTEMNNSFLITLCILTFSCTAIYSQSPERGDTRIVVISDMNESYGSTQYNRHVDTVLAYIEKWQPDAVLTAGDHIAGQNLGLGESTLYAMWNAFEAKIAGPLRDMDIPLGVTMGNHDASGSGSFDRERKIAKEFWSSRASLLNLTDGENFPFYYSFTVNDLFVLSWDASFHEIPIAQQRWLAGELQSEAARNASHRILIGHLPLYPTAVGRNRRGEILKNADQLFELIRDNGVDIYISGHHHAYYPAIKDGVLLLSSGAVGSGPRQLLGSDAPARRTLSIIDFSHDTGNYELKTYDIKNDMSIVLPEELPKLIQGINGTLTRFDRD